MTTLTDEIARAIEVNLTPEPNVTRFEVIDETGRAYTRHEVEIELSYQDDGRTLKVFVRPHAR